MKKTLFVLTFSLFLLPSVSLAAGLTYQQASSIIMLLQAFRVDQAIINEVWSELVPSQTPTPPPTVAITQPTQPPAVQTPVTPTPVVPVPVIPVLPPTLTITANASYGPQLVNPGSRNVEIGSFVLTGTNQQLNVTSIGLNIANGDIIQNLVLKDDSTGHQINTIKNQASSGLNEFDGSPVVVVQKDSSVVVDVYADIASNAAGTIQLSANANSIGMSNGIAANSFTIPLQLIQIQTQQALQVQANQSCITQQEQNLQGNGFTPSQLLSMAIQHCPN